MRVQDTNRQSELYSIQGKHTVRNGGLIFGEYKVEVMDRKDTQSLEFTIVGRLTKEFNIGRN